MDYSILMSVYFKEDPTYFKESIESMLNQTVKSNDFVIVCDGVLTDQLYEVLDYYESQPQNCIHRVQLEKNVGLGEALNIGLNHCKNGLIARMDSDDISVKNRIELQLKEFEKNKELALCGGYIYEFNSSLNNIIGKRIVPSKYEEIVSFSKKRNPFNHPSVMFKKECIQNVGSYKEDFHFFEDYYLWIRVLKNGYMGENIESNLVYMRTSLDLYARRGGLKYAKDMLEFRFWMFKINWTNISNIIFHAIPHAIVCILPNKLRKQIYKIIH